MKLFFLYLMAFFYIAAGINHFVNPRFYKKIMPSWISFHDPLVYLSGFFEILFGALLMFEYTRTFAAWGIILLLIAVFPANIQMLQNFKRKNNPYTWLAIIRLPIQALLIWWAWSYTY